MKRLTLVLLTALPFLVGATDDGCRSDREIARDHLGGGATCVAVNDAGGLFRCIRDGAVFECIVQSTHAEVEVSCASVGRSSTEAP